MRLLILAGAALLAIGGIIVGRGLTYRSDESVLRVGEFEARVEQRRTVPTWIGAVAIGAGLLLVGAGVKRRG